MALIKINGVEIPTPASYSVGIQDISKAERNANGTMIIERIATKRKIEIGWGLITSETAGIVLNAVSPIFFTVEYVDPQENAVKIGTFYCGDRTTPMLIFTDGIAKYKDLKFNLVER
ncbi:MAG: DUF6711 family protein [Clostridium sp.]|uniref:DUF6711 family protein n=1 Tax=Clostridium sp. TaxID=1506 RepID=UPI00303ACC1A